MFRFRQPDAVSVNFGRLVENGLHCFYFHGPRPGGRWTSSGRPAGPALRWKRGVNCGQRSRRVDCRHLSYKTSS